MATTNTLSDATIRKAKPGEKPRKLSDGGGLYLELQPNGGKWWRLKYRHEGKEKRIGLGTYPEVTLSEARKRRDDARALVAAGTDPSEARKAGKAEHQRQQEAEALAAAGEPLPGTFEAVARDWLAVRRDEWAPSYFEKIEARDTIESVRRVRETCSLVFRFAVAERGSQVLEQLTGIDIYASRCAT